MMGLRTEKMRMSWEGKALGADGKVEDEDRRFWD